MVARGAEVSPQGRDPAAALEVPVGTLLRSRDRAWDSRGVVTDRWFDPVAGQRRPRSGEMCGIRMVDWYDLPYGGKVLQRLGGIKRYWETLPGAFDFISAEVRREAMRTGSVVGIGKGLVIRRRPKIAGL